MASHICFFNFFSSGGRRELFLYKILSLKLGPTWSQWHVAFAAAWVKLTQTTHGDDMLQQKRKTCQCHLSWPPFCSLFLFSLYHPNCQRTSPSHPTPLKFVAKLFIYYYYYTIIVLGRNSNDGSIIICSLLRRMFRTELVPS